MSPGEALVSGFRGYGGSRNRWCGRRWIHACLAQVSRGPWPLHRRSFGRGRSQIRIDEGCRIVLDPHCRELTHRKMFLAAPLALARQRKSFR
jgi:hypothetical protein